MQVERYEKFQCVCQLQANFIAIDTVPSNFSNKYLGCIIIYLRVTCRIRVI